MSLAFFSSILQDRRALAAAPFAYLLLVRLLRYRRRAWHEHLLKRDGPNLSDMSVSTAQRIWGSLAQQEFPQMVALSLNFALFRTYGVPSISGLLAETGRLSSASYVDRRLADTTALIVEMTNRPLFGQEWTEGMARLNCIHEHYIVKGRILMDDMRYTLALFALEPTRWVGRYEWRPLTDVERCATGVLWGALGDAMGITWTGLRSFDAGEPWRDGLHFVEELAEWTEKYEKEVMVPADSNAKVAQHTSDMLLSTLPQRIQKGALRVLTAFMDDRLRLAVKMPEPGPTFQRWVDAYIALRRAVLRNLVLPRPYYLRVAQISETRNSHGLVNLNYYHRSPFYVEPTLWKRFGPASWIARLQGVAVPGPDEYKPTGYDPRTVGPNIAKEMQDDMEDKVKSRAKAVGTCPFGGGQGNTEKAGLRGNGTLNGKA